MRIRLEGLDKLEATLKGARNPAQRLAGPIYLEAERIMTESKRLVPVDVGTLRASGVVQSPDVSGKKVTVELGYGGAARAYALVQHERLDYHHNVGQAKYLEQPVKEAASGFGERVARNLDLFR